MRKWGGTTVSDFTIRLEEARRKLPLRTLMEQRGKGPENGNWKRFPKCPFCGKDGSGMFPVRNGDQFKCHHTSCPSATCVKGAAFDEVGFLAHELNLSQKEACITLMKEAGVWQDRETVRSGKPGRKIPPPSDTEQAPPPPVWSDATGAPGVEGEAGLGPHTNDLAPPAASVVPGEIPGGLAANGQPAPGVSDNRPGPDAGGARETPGQLSHESEPDGDAKALPSSPDGEGAQSGGCLLYTSPSPRD